MRLVAPFMVTIAVALVAGPARAQDKKQCLSAHADAQMLKREGKYRAAEEQLLICSGGSCPSLVAHDCVAWLAETRAEQPTVIVSATDEAGHETAHVSVSVDGQRITDRLDGLPLAVDPGEHAFRYELATGKVVEERIVVRAREKDRALRVAFAEPADIAPPKPPATAPSDATAARAAAIPLPAWIAGGTAIVAGGAWAFFGLTGKARESELADSCAPGCAKSDIDDVSRRYVLADVAMAVTLTAIATTVIVVLVARPTPRALAQASAGVRF